VWLLVLAKYEKGNCVLLSQNYTMTAEAIQHVPANVQQKIREAIQLIDVDQDGIVTYLEFMYILTELKDYIKITEKHIHDTKPNIKDVEFGSISTTEAENWSARIYLKCVDEKELDQISDSTTTEEPDVLSLVKPWNLDKIVVEVFGEDKIAPHADLLSTEDEYTDEDIEEYKEQRIRKRDIVAGVLKSFVSYVKPAPVTPVTPLPEVSITPDSTEEHTPTVNEKPKHKRQRSGLLNFFASSRDDEESYVRDADSPHYRLSTKEKTVRDRFVHMNK
jgi:hypothetical protein